MVGICALCLKERLLVLASEQNGLPQPGGTKRPSRTLKRTPSVNLRNVFALGSLLQLLDNRYHRSKDTSSGEDSIASLEGTYFPNPQTLVLYATKKIREDEEDLNTQTERERARV